jgi:hypothetical protein
MRQIYICSNPKCNEKPSLRFLKDIFELGFTAFVVLTDCRCEEMLAKNKTVDRGNNFQRTGWWCSQLVRKKMYMQNYKKELYCSCTQIAFLHCFLYIHFYIVLEIMWIRYLHITTAIKLSDWKQFSFKIRFSVVLSI